MWQPGETINFRASDHVRAIHRHTRGKLIEYVVVNNAPIGVSLRRRYAKERAQPVENDLDNIFRMGLEVMSGNLVTVEDRKVRHDPDEISAVALKLALQGRMRRVRQ
jgi:uncharacterized cofD-like protein